MTKIIVTNDWYFSILFTLVFAVFLLFDFYKYNFKYLFAGFRRIFYTVCILIPTSFFITSLIILPAIYSIINFIFLLSQNGLDSLKSDASSGLMSLRICSVISAVTTITFYKNKYVPSVIFDKIDDKNKTSNISLLSHYEFIAKSFGNMGNLFFNSAILYLWAIYVYDLNNQLLPYLTLVLFFIIDDWAILIHFILKAERAITKAHRIRVYFSVIAIIILAYYDLPQETFVMKLIAIPMFFLGIITLFSLFILSDFAKDIKKIDAIYANNNLDEASRIVAGRRFSSK